MLIHAIKMWTSYHKETSKTHIKYIIQNGRKDKRYVRKKLLPFPILNKKDSHWSLREKCMYSKFFWSVFSRIRTEYGEIRSISPYSVRLREKIWMRTLFTQCDVSLLSYNACLKRFNRSKECVFFRIKWH